MAYPCAWKAAETLADFPWSAPGEVFAIRQIRRRSAPPAAVCVENTVAHVATWIIAGLRQRQFTSLPELRAAIIERVAAYNAEPFQ
jgi:hypothetical protein